MEETVCEPSKADMQKQQSSAQMSLAGCERKGLIIYTLLRNPDMF